jgi:hypothetical protein
MKERERESERERERVKERESERERVFILRSYLLLNYNHTLKALYLYEPHL